MAMRMNDGYIITDSVHFDNVEFVLGISVAVPSQFVTWECRNGTDYHCAHYMSDWLSAIKDLLERATQELEIQMQHRKPANKIKPEKEHER